MDIQKIAKISIKLWISIAKDSSTSGHVTKQLYGPPVKKIGCPKAAPRQRTEAAWRLAQGCRRVAAQRLPPRLNFDRFQPRAAFGAVSGQSIEWLPCGCLRAAPWLSCIYTQEFPVTVKVMPNCTVKTTANMWNSYLLNYSTANVNFMNNIREAHFKKNHLKNTSRKITKIHHCLNL